MTLYEIDAAMEQFIAENINTETGEIANLEHLEELQLARENKIEAIALAYKNYSAELDALKKEKKNFEERIAKVTRSAESCKNYLAYALCGEKFKK